MAQCKKIYLSREDPDRLKKYHFLRVGKFLLIVEDLPINQIKIYGEPKV